MPEDFWFIYELQR